MVKNFLLHWLVKYCILFGENYRYGKIMLNNKISKL